MAARERKERKEKGMNFHFLRSLCSFAAEKLVVGLLALVAASRQSAAFFAAVGEVGGALPRRRYAGSISPLLIFTLFVSNFYAIAQTNPPPATYVRQVVNDLPDQPLVTVTVAGAVNVACFTIEETLPGPASAVSVSGDGVYLPAQNAIRWGPYFNTVATNVSYRLTGMPASYPVNGGAWMDGQWYFSPAATLVTVLPPGGAGVPTVPPQVAPPTFTPISGASVPTNVTISCSTTGAVIYYTLDGSLPTTSSLLYTGTVSLASASVVRARAFTNGWLPSVASVAYYGSPAASVNAQVTRSVNTNPPTAPTITFNVVPGTNAACVAVTESLPLGLSATNVSAGGNYIASNNVVLWGPFFGTNAQVLTYQAVGQPGTYAVRGSWSVDGLGASEAVGTNIVIVSSSGSGVPTPPQQVAAPTFTPASGSNVSVNVTIACATPGAVVYYTLNGSLPTASSLLYTGAVHLASASTVRAVGFTNGWLSSVASVAYYGPSAAPANAQVTRNVNTNSPTTPVLTFSVVPGANASCVAVTESLPLGISAASVSAGGNYIASNNVVLWGPFFGTNAQTLSYQAVGQPGTYATRATWSVDGVSGGETVGTNLVVAYPPGSGFPTAPPQEPMPTLTPTIASNLPVTVSISSSDPQGQIYFTTDGSLPTQSSTPYTTALNFSTRTTLLARSFRNGYLPSQLAAGYYTGLQMTNSLALVRSVVGSGTFLPSITVTATPSLGVNCYSVTETVTPGLTPYDLETNAVWNPSNGTIRWGPYMDNQPRVLSYVVTGLSGNHALTGQGSFNGYAASIAGASAVSVNVNYSGSPDTSFTTCATLPLSYSLTINPADHVILDSVSGTLNWGDGTHESITALSMTFQKTYATAGTYTISWSADWTGHYLRIGTPGGGGGAIIPMSGHATKTDTVQAVAQCNPPVITAQPQPSNQVVFAGSTVQFSVTATSLFPMSFQRYFNRTNPFIGPIFSTLTLPNVSPQAAGLYSVLVTNAYGSVTSSVVSLGVVTPLVTSIIRNSNKSVTLNFVGLPNSATRIWAATNLAPPALWQAISTNNNVGTNGTWQFTDTNTVGYPARFYRFSTP